MERDNIYVIASYTNTWPGRLIRARAALKFWNRYPGDYYSHISLSRDNHLNHMVSFARKEMKNPFNSGMVEEDIRKGFYSINPEKNKIAIMAIPVTENQHQAFLQKMDEYWEHKDEYGFNFLGLISMLFYAKGVDSPNRFFCSQWAATVLEEIGIDIFNGIPPRDIRPFDFYGALYDQIIYEGTVENYLSSLSNNESGVEKTIQQESETQKILQYKHNSLLTMRKC